MADAATDFLLNNLKELVQYHFHLIGETKGNIENLHRDLRVFKAFLRDTVKTRKKNERVKEMVKEIHDIVYDVQDMIDVFVTKSIGKNLKSDFSRFWNTLGDFNSIGKEVEAIKDRVEWFRADISLLSVEEDKDEKPEPRPPRKKNVAGFSDVTEDIIRRLTQETDYFDVISLIGMFGLGKTTLAWMIFNEPQIVFKFPTRIWLPVSQQFTEKEVFLNILKELTTINEDIRAADEHELADMVAAGLQKESFLIVMDDIWSRDDWKRISVALPFDNTNGKVLITSRQEEVGAVASMPRPPYQLRFFTSEESWELLRLEALGRLDCPPELEDVGRRIAEYCRGLPNAIVVIGGILAESLGTDMNETRRKWMKVSEHVSSYLTEKDPTRRMEKFISLSYENLPYHLRACFLYLGLFPEDYEICVSKLIRMWIAEGFIQQKVEYSSLEEIGEKYLDDLMNRNLVKAVKFKPDGKVKTCQIHDTLRDFCRIEAASENLLQEIKYNSDGQCVPAISNIGTYRRLSIHSNCLRFISSRPFGPRVRTFVCFSEDNYVVSPENSTNIIGAFKLVKVLDVLPFKFTKIDSELYDLFHLRYIAFSCELSILPSEFNQLRNIQTLIVDTKSRTLEVEADIWEMKHLRHFKINASATLPKPSRGSYYGAELQTLGLISVESCTEELPKRARNLKKLGIRGKLALLFDRKNGSFDSLKKMEHLEKLKLVNDAYPKPRRGSLDCLPEYYRFPSGLKSLTICATYLSWEHTSTLGLLEKLEVLKLKDHAFVGGIWMAKDGGFHSLETLHIEQTDLAFWRASFLSYPKLRSLVLKNCDKLREIPVELADIPSLEMMELYICIYAAKSAKKISNAKRMTRDGGSAFTLSIYPSIE